MKDEYFVEQPKPDNLNKTIPVHQAKPQNEISTEKTKKEPVSFYSESGELLYKIENGKLQINPKFASFVRIGMKTSENKEHWTNEFILNPHKKTMICFGGDQTKSAREANGYINLFAQTYGFTKEQLNDMQMLSYYYDIPSDLFFTVHWATNNKELIENDYAREVSKVFRPFIAKQTQTGWEKLSDKDLLDNMHNIMFSTHCAGTNIMIRVIDTLKQQMLLLGYKEKLVDTALKQILSITNNSQLEMTENILTTTLQRYSVADGQSDMDYDQKYSNSYPIHLFEHPEFKKIKGKRSAFIKLRNNDVLMAFDKILTKIDRQYSSIEHNSAFFTTCSKNLTFIGRKQMQLIQMVAQYWYNNHDEIPDVVDLLKQVSKGTDLEVFVATSILNGKILKKEHNNPLQNPHSLKVAVNRFKNQDIEPDHTGIWKFIEKSKGHN